MFWFFSFEVFSRCVFLEGVKVFCFCVEEGLGGESGGTSVLAV